VPSIKCLTCGHRNLHATANSKCSNCGTPLAAEPFAPQTIVSEEPSTYIPSSPASTTGIRTNQRSAGFLPPPTDAVGTQREQAPSAQHSNGQALSLHTSSSRARWAKERAREHSQALVSYQETLPATVKPRQVQEIRTQVEPYQERDISTTVYQNPFGNASSIFPSPYSADERSSPVIMQNPTPPAAPAQPQWTLEELPPGYKRQPTLAGTLINVQGQMEEYHAIDIMGSLVKLLADMIWPSSAAQDAQRREKDQVFITTLRIRTAAGIQRDARVQGHLTSANVTLGDTILLWGRNKGGALLVSRGYNYTSKSKITSRVMSSSLPFFLITIAMVIGMIAFLYWRHISLFALFHH
jgi:hypothetical protein